MPWELRVAGDPTPCRCSTSSRLRSKASWRSTTVLCFHGARRYLRSRRDGVLILQKELGDEERERILGDYRGTSKRVGKHRENDMERLLTVRNYLWTSPFSDMPTDMISTTTTSHTTCHLLRSATTPHAPLPWSGEPSASSI